LPAVTRPSGDTTLVSLNVGSRLVVGDSCLTSAGDGQQGSVSPPERGLVAAALVGARLHAAVEEVVDRLAVGAGLARGADLPIRFSLRRASTASATRRQSSPLAIAVMEAETARNV
jgi:hypothetical protein